MHLPNSLRPHVVGILGFDGVAALDFIGPLEAFRAARTLDRARPCYEVVTLSLNGRKFISESGLPFKADKRIDEVRSIDTVLIPGGRGWQLPELHERIAAWLYRNRARIRRIATVSDGIYPLAQSGLTDDRQVTTHWRYARDVAQRFPKLRVNYAASFLRDGSFFSCSGGKAALEMTLAMIDEDFGPEASRAVAREFVLRLKPSGTEDLLVPPPPEQCEARERLSDLPTWILAHLHEDLSVKALAQNTSLCVRHFGRVFKRVFQIPPAEFVEQLRMNEARRRLLAGQTTIKCVADSVGFRSPDVFRRAFERSLGMTPTKFRLCFRARAERRLKNGAALVRRQARSQRSKGAVENVEKKIRVSTR